MSKWYYGALIGLLSNEGRLIGHELLTGEVEAPDRPTSEEIICREINQKIKGNGENKKLCFWTPKIIQPMCEYCTWVLSFRKTKNYFF